MYSLLNLDTVAIIIGMNENLKKRRNSHIFRRSMVMLNEKYVV